MERLRNVPVVPPLESLRHIGLVLIKDLPEINESVGKEFRTILKKLQKINFYEILCSSKFSTTLTLIFLEKYLRSACKELKSDLTACYVCLLEHKDEQSRRGACRALAVLQVIFTLLC